MADWAPYICPLCRSALNSPTPAELVCATGHHFPVFMNGELPAFSFQEEDVSDYSIKKAAEVHDKSLEWLLAAHHTTEDSFRHQILATLRLTSGQRVLVTGAGAGNDLPYLCSAIGKDGEIYAQDFSRQMLFAAYERARGRFDLGEFNIHFSLSDAVQLPFESDFFDVVYHFGGINVFSDIPKGVSEMERVVRKGGRVVFGDEGLAPWLKHREIGKMLIRNNPLYAHDIPLQFLTESASDVSVTWVINNCYYVVAYTNTKEPLPVDIDLRHEGTRGGSIRTRYFGLLEGIDPALKEKLYAAATESGKSRVQFLEDLISSALKSKASAE